MYIVNEHGVLMGWPDEWPVPAASRKATEYEIGCFETTGQQRVDLMPVAHGDSEPPPAQPDSMSGVLEGDGDEPWNDKGESLGRLTYEPDSVALPKPAKPKRSRKK